jgi:hypothetical protein
METKDESFWCVNKFWVEGSKNCIVVAAESHHSLGE